MPLPAANADAGSPSLTDLRLPSLDAMRAFEVAARLGSFERAAEALHITASAVSKRIGSLEELLGTPLLQRSAKALLLTAQGRDYLQAIRPVLADLAAIPLHRRPSQGRQRLRLCCPPTLARQILVPALPTFTDRHPEVELEVLLSTPYLDQQPIEADLVVRHGPRQPVGPPALMADVLLPLATPALLREAPCQSVADLARLPLLRTPLDPWLPWFQAQALDWPEPDQGPRLVDLGLTLEAALQGQGVMLARPSLACQALRSGQLVPALGRGRTPWISAASAYGLLTEPDGDAPGAVTALRSWLQQACAQAASDGLAWISAAA